MQQLRATSDSPHFTVAAAWPNEPYFNQATTFDVIPSAWQLIGITEKHSPWLQIFETYRAILLAKLYIKGAQNIIPFDWVKLFSAYQQADIIASVSSTHFYSTGRYGWPFPVKIMMVNFAHLFKKPFYVMPQSIGPLRWEWEKKMLRSAYEKARLVFLRDQASMRLAEAIHLPKDRIRLTADPAFAFPAASHYQAVQLLSKYGYTSSSPAIGMSLIPWQGRWVNENIMTKYFHALANFIIRFNRETNAQFYLLNQVTGPTRLDDDRVAAKILVEYLGTNSNCLTYVNEILPPDILKACYGCMDLFIASRLHSGIFAMGMNIPVVFIGYMAKTRGMMELLGVEDWVIDLDKVNVDILIEKTFLAWSKRETRQEKLRVLIPQVIQQVNETEYWIRQDYAQFKA